MAGNLDFRLNLLANTTGLQQGVNGAKFAVNALVAAMAAVGVGVSISGLATAADSYTTLSARINIATKDGGNFASAMAGVHQVALSTNSSLEATGNLFTKINDTGKQMGMTQQQALDLTKTINQAIQIGGGSAQASEAALQQFIQALQSGVLRGDEFNSIMEQAPGLTSAMAKGIGVTTGELRKMAEAGELGAERITKAIQSQAGQIQATYDKFPTTIGNALTKISTQWQILIGTMDQSTGASATVAQWLVTIADNMDVVETILEDIGEGFIWAGDQLKKIDPATIEAFKTALESAYATLKTIASTMGESFEITMEVLNTSLGFLFDWNSGVDTANDKTNGFTKALQRLDVALGTISDGFAGLMVLMNLLAGAAYAVAGAFQYYNSLISFGDAKEKAFKDFQDLTKMSDDYYQRADDLAMGFESKRIAATNEISKTQKEKDAESVASSKAKMESLLADQKTEVDGKKATEAEKLSAVQTYAEAAIKANDGVMDGVMQADLMTRGYIATLGESGKVGVEAWSKNKEGAESTANATDKARKAAATLKLDLYELKNGITETFNTNSKVLSDFANGVEQLGFKGEKAGNAIYQAWLKWLETAKSQNEVDAAMLKLQEFGRTGQMSTKQVEMGMLALRQVIQKLPADLDPVEQAFERLGIKTKEQLKLAAQSALADFNTIQVSGKATAEGIRQAYERTMQAAAASGDASVIAATNAKAASLGLEVQIDSTGKASVKSMDELTSANDRVRNSAERIGDGYRHAGNIAREEAKSSTEAWNEAVKASSDKFKAEMKRQGESLSKGIYDYDSYSRADVLSQLKGKGYSDKEAEKLAGSIWSEAMSADRAAKEQGLGKDGSLAVKALINAEYNNAASKGLTTQHGTNKINELMRQMTASNLVSTGPSTKPVDVNSLAPNVSAPKPATTTTDVSKTVKYEFNSGGKAVTLYGSPNDGDAMEALLSEFEMLKKRS
ncbi:tape measure protein [Acinetobacter terrestris]|uniref:Tape measure protein n=1 Tax=Acinetobacter terrestris TaxID=2529843 RepID=A0ABX1USE6_9GAMM|nr:tape measure protein [Acinetobacter terrestris]NNH25679.1 tape measure protein [Acinetobacter terrestris]